MVSLFFSHYSLFSHHVVDSNDLVIGLSAHLILLPTNDYGS